MSFIRFLFREGSSILYSLFLLAFSYMTPAEGVWPHSVVGLFAFVVICLAYLGMQMAMAAFASVGHDKPLFDLFFSIIPLFALFGIVVLAAVDQVKLAPFHVYALTISAAIAFLDVIFNTQVVFKMNRLATDMVQMR